MRPDTTAINVVHKFQFLVIHRNAAVTDPVVFNATRRGTTLKKVSTTERIGALEEVTVPEKESPFAHCVLAKNFRFFSHVLFNSVV